MPILQTTREKSRMMACRDHLRQLGVALLQYHDAYESFPAGVTGSVNRVQLDPPEFHPGWITSLLPYLDQPVLAKEFRPELPGEAPENRRSREFAVSTLICPTFGDARHDEQTGFAISNYAGCHDSGSTSIDRNNNGILFLNAHLNRDDISDGVSTTILVGEALPDPATLGWAAGSNSTLRNTGLSLFESRRIPPTPVPVLELPSEMPEQIAQIMRAAPPSSGVARPDWYEPPVRAVDPNRQKQPPPVPIPESFALTPGGFGSDHPGGVQFLLADGLVRFFSLRMDGRTLQQLADRADGLPQSGNDF